MLGTFSLVSWWLKLSNVWKNKNRKNKILKWTNSIVNTRTTIFQRFRLDHNLLHTKWNAFVHFNFEKDHKESISKLSVFIKTSCVSLENIFVLVSFPSLCFCVCDQIIIIKNKNKTKKKKKLERKETFW